MIKKIIITVIICTLLLSLVPAFAQVCSITIQNPQNGSVVPAWGFDAEIKAEGDISYLSVKINGKKTEFENNDGVIIVKVKEEELFLGVNTLSVIAVFADGTSKKETSSFTVAEQGASLVSSYSFLGGLPTSWDKGIMIPTDSGENVSCTISEATGPAGGEDTAVKFSLPDADNISTSRATHSTYILHRMPTFTTPIEIEYDLYFSTNKYSFYHETKNDQNAYAFLHNTKALFGPNGIVDHSIGEKFPDGYKYPVGEWMHVKHFIDFTKSVGSMWINDELIFENVSQGASGTGISLIKFQYDITPTEVSSDSFYMIDNVQYSRVSNTVGITKAENVENNIKIYLDNVATEAKKDDIRLYMLGTEMQIADVLTDTTEKTITITPSGELVPQSECKAVLSKSVIGAKYDTACIFKTKAEKISVDNVSFYGEKGEIYHVKALENIDKINVSVSVSETDEENMGAVAVFTLYCDNTPVQVKVKSVEYENGTPLPCVSSLDIPEDKENVFVECFVIDNFTAGTPLSSVWSIARD